MERQLEKDNEGRDKIVRWDLQGERPAKVK